MYKYGKNIMMEFSCGNYGIFRQDMKIVKMSEKLRDKFYSIEVAGKLLNQNNPSRSLYFPPSCRVDRINDENLNFDFSLVNGEYKGRVPIYVWAKLCGELYYYFILDLEFDFTLKYPVTKIVADRDNEVDDRQLIYSEEELIEELESLLRTM